MHMPLAVGTKLGPYEVLSTLGKGGMGEVYRARDTRLNRTVAIKILAAADANQAEFQTRLAREAKAISSLNHPHICTVYDFGLTGGQQYLILEYLNGEICQ